MTHVSLYGSGPKVPRKDAQVQESCEYLLGFCRRNGIRWSGGFPEIGSNRKIIL